MNDSSSTKWASLALVLLGCTGVGAVGCSSGQEESGAESAAELSAPCEPSDAVRARICPGPTTLKGIDVSFWQGTPDWTRVKATGQSFVFIRASDGVSHPDTQFARNWPEAKRVGLVRGVYQYFRPNVDVNAQVDVLASKLAGSGGLEVGDLPPVLDFETDAGMPASTVVARAKAWLAAVEQRLGMRPIVYTAAFMSPVIGDSLKDYTLWVANYGATCPNMPSGWTSWKFWQTSDSGSVSGISGNVDTNLFNGTFDDLMALTLPAPAPPSSPAPTAAAHDEAPADGDEGAVMGDGIRLGRCAAE